MLLDYSIHFLDLAWMFGKGDMHIASTRVCRDIHGDTESISAKVDFTNYDCSIFLRQGRSRRRCVIEYVFQNYNAVLKFFPDTLSMFPGTESFLDDFAMAWGEGKATAAKVIAKIRAKQSDDSHLRVIDGFLRRDRSEKMLELRFERIRETYRRLESLSDSVYGKRL